MAEEFIAIVTQLWDSWDPGAIVADRKSGVLIDHTKVHTIDFEGQYRPQPRPAEFRPVSARPSGDRPGRRLRRAASCFAAKHADTIVAHVKGVDAMKTYRQNAHANMRDAGAIPTDLQAAVPDQPDPRRHGRGRAGKSRAASHRPRRAWTCASRSWAGSPTSTFPSYDLDAPVGELTTNGHQQSLAQFLRKAGKRTLREAIIDHTTRGASVDLVGTPDQVAGQMAEVMEEVGGDGFLFTRANMSRRTIAEVDRRPRAGAATTRTGAQRLRAQAVPRQSAGILSRP